ncbi:hypothetical protein KFL_006630040 [Klebsormidium nitens]|uniref:Uncharacterized protein n=1 Tax=Klebsormidium nitens TaxID=105231 RepID=A0A1Y1IPQ5_KLENI|nr:hypothetical protein KFL_006630040 [Klebsormidium nitens]|eukprot:GAQ90617.1 hypothetical protein KFL_006630040 [Klebsormidium nitens]
MAAAQSFICKKASAPLSTRTSEGAGVTTRTAAALHFGDCIRLSHAAPRSCPNPVVTRLRPSRAHAHEFGSPLLNRNNLQNGGQDDCGCAERLGRCEASA